ncbi:MAG TPA: hypothetical protein VEC16_01115 [Alphaproteobacteria bacterium]|nr:hypothetical protein [Alphaproteobacteria bacterium]
MIPNTLKDLAKLLNDKGPNLTLSIYSPEKETNIATINTPQNTKELISRLDYLSDLFHDNGEFNPYSKIAETYAVSLNLDKKHAQSFKLFDLITRDVLSPKDFKPKVLYNLFNFSNFSEPGKILLPVKNLFGNIGFEGAYQFACACYYTQNKSKSKDLLQMIADLPEEYEGGLRLLELRANSTYILSKRYGIAKYQPEAEKWKNEFFKKIGENVSNN